MTNKLLLGPAITQGQQLANGAMLLAILLGLSFAAIQPVWAQTFKVLHRFTGGEDGGSPAATPLIDEEDNLYGTTYQGGAFNYGVVFKLDRNGKETVLHSFTSADGMWPEGSLIRDAEGNLYGTTSDGGTAEGGGCVHGCGTVFKVDKTGKETVLYAFTGGADGGNPFAGLIRDAEGSFYGTTLYGGNLDCNSGQGCGTVFSLDASGKETVLYAFTGAADGAFPSSGLIRDDAGNLYGMTTDHGLYLCLDRRFSCGTVFKLDKAGKETVLYAFTGGPDGGNPSGAFIRDAAGNFYGATVGGGDLSGCMYGCGTVFKLDNAGKETVIYAFTGGAAGYSPTGVIRDAAGNFYGTTQYGGALSECFNTGCGTVFKVDATGKEVVLHTFQSKESRQYIQSQSLIEDHAGNLYGAFPSGFAVGCSPDCGAVYELTP
jgi:uncharacterized repeat protein (TIGR03803 family)